MRKIDIKPNQLKRRIRIRAKINGTKERPRISVFRSNRYLYGQAIDDNGRITLAAFSTKKINDKKLTPKQRAREGGKKLAELLLKIGITRAVFDRNRYAYHGQVAEFAAGLREGGIKI